MSECIGDSSSEKTTFVMTPFTGLKLRVGSAALFPVLREGECPAQHSVSLT